MATGPEHYREAERLLKQAYHYTYGDGADPVTGNALASAAIGHALLAHVAVTATSAPVDGCEPGMSTDVWRDWTRTLAVQPADGGATDE